VRARVTEDAERCGRSFEAQVVAILGRHDGEDVDIAPGPGVILELALGSLAGMSFDERAMAPPQVGTMSATTSCRCTSYRPVPPAFSPRPGAVSVWT
jgi:hypothetical protein